MSEEETVEVTVKLPKAIVEFLKDMTSNMEEYIVHNIVQMVEADLEADEFYNPKQVVEKYNLMPVFEKHDISVSSHVKPEVAEK